VPAELLERIRRFVLNDDQPVAMPCVAQGTPGTAFPNLTALTHTPRGAP
jgi:hypothetical protein